MDPITALGAASGVLGIASFAIDLSIGISTLASRMRSANDSLKNAERTVKSTATVLGQIEDLIKQEQTNVKRSRELQIFSAPALFVVGETLNGCLRILWKLEAIVLGKKEPDEHKLSERLDDRSKSASEKIQLEPGFVDSSLRFWAKIDFAFNKSEKLKEYSKQLGEVQLTLLVTFSLVMIKHLQEKSVLTQADLEVRFTALRNLKRPKVHHVAQAVLDEIKARKATDPTPHQSIPAEPGEETTRDIQAVGRKSGSHHNPRPNINLAMTKPQRTTTTTTGRRGPNTQDQGLRSQAYMFPAYFEPSQSLRERGYPIFESPHHRPVPDLRVTAVDNTHVDSHSSPVRESRGESDHAKLPALLKDDGGPDSHLVTATSGHVRHQDSIPGDLETRLSNERTSPRWQHQVQDRIRAFMIQGGSAYSIPYSTELVSGFRAMKLPQDVTEGDDGLNKTSFVDFDIKSTSRMFARLAEADRKALMDILSNADGSTAHSLIRLENLENKRRLKVWDRSPRPVLAIVLRRDSHSHKGQGEYENLATQRQSVPADAERTSQSTPQDEPEYIRIFTLRKKGEWQDQSEEGLPHYEVVRRLAKLDKQSLSAFDKKLALPIDYQIWVSNIQETLNAEDAENEGCQWTLRQLELKQRVLGQFRGRRGVLAVVVYLQRQQRLGLVREESGYAQKGPLGPGLPSPLMLVDGDNTPHQPIVFEEHRSARSYSSSRSRAARLPGQWPEIPGEAARHAHFHHVGQLQGARRSTLQMEVGDVERADVIGDRPLRREEMGPAVPSRWYDAEDRERLEREKMVQAMSRPVIRDFSLRAEKRWRSDAHIDSLNEEYSGTPIATQETAEIRSLSAATSAAGSQPTSEALEGDGRNDSILGDEVLNELMSELTPGQ